jgi:WD40 repeat protein
MADKNAIAAQESKNEAQKQARLAEYARIQSEKNLQKANSLIKVSQSKDTLKTDATKSLFLAYDAVKLDTTKESLEALMDAAYHIHYSSEITSNVGIRKVKESPLGDEVAIGLENGQIKLFNLISGKCKVLLGNQNVTALTYTPDGQNLISAGEDHLIKIWSVPDAKFVKSLNVPPTVYKDFAFDQNNRLIACSIDSKIRYINYLNNKVEYEHEIPGFYDINRIAISSQDKMMGVQSSEGVVLLDNTGKEIFRKNSPGITSIDFSPGGDMFMFTENYGRVYFYNTINRDTFSVPVSEDLKTGKFISNFEIILSLKNGKMMLLDIFNKKVDDKIRNVWIAHTLTINNLELVVTSGVPQAILSYTNNSIRLWNIRLVQK